MYLHIITFVIAIFREYINVLTDRIVRGSRILSNEEKDMIKSHQDLKSELSTVSMGSDYVRYIQITRQINKIQELLETINSARLKDEVEFKGQISKGMYAFLASCFIFIIFFNGFNTYVHQFTKPDWFFPLDRLLSLSSGIPGTVSLPCWMFVCTTVIRAFKA
uniref:Tryptophan rich basic protein [Ochotona princeps] n=1 Tax=Lepeophtheirus salmonis TaxID=72036 RepID=D3PIY2_LEPSM|nr:Tryptophan-rich protein [Lepeophtheirus salmonis]